MDNIVIGMFDDTDEAMALVNDLTGHGIPRDHISIEASQKTVDLEDHRGFFQKIGDLLSGRDSRALAEGVRRGAVVVSARVDDPLIDETVDLMKSHGAVDIDERTEGWREEGWVEESTKPDQRIAAKQPVITEEQRVPVVQEALRVGKREVVRGGVRVYAHVEERPVEEQVRLREEHVMVDRHPVDQPARADDPALFREGTIEVTERAEEAVVAKEARVVEEVVVGKEVQERVETVRDTVRRTDVEVEPIDGANSLGAGSTDDFDRYSSDFQQHFRTIDPIGNLTYDQYLPAYRYGWQLGGQDQYRGRDWASLESDFRRSWEPGHPNSWDRFKDAIRYGWQRRTSTYKT